MKLVAAAAWKSGKSLNWQKRLLDLAKLSIPEETRDLKPQTLNLTGTLYSTP